MYSFINIYIYHLYQKRISYQKCNNPTIQVIKNYQKKGAIPIKCHATSISCYCHTSRRCCDQVLRMGIFFAVAVDVATTTILGTNISPTKALLKIIFFPDARSDRRRCLTDLRRCVLKTKIGLEQGFWKTQRCNQNLTCAIVTVVGLNLNPNTSQRCCEDQNIMQLSEKIRTNLKVRMGSKELVFPPFPKMSEAYMASDVQRKPLNSYKRLCAKVKCFSGIVLVQCTWMISGNPSIMGHNMVWILALESLV